MKNILLSGFLCLLLISCGQSMMNTDMLSQAYEKAEYEAPASGTDEAKEINYSTSEERTDLPINTQDDAQIKVPDKIIKTADLNVEVENYQEAIKLIREKVKANKAYISHEDENNYGYMVSNNIVIRVVKENFDTLINALERDVKKVNHKNISTQDVTEEYVDIETRLKTKKEVENRYTELLKKAYSIGDILEVEEKIRQIREEIEAKEGRLKFLNDQVDYSTISLTVSQYYKTDYNEPGFWSKIGEALEGGWNGLLVLLIGLVYIWPLWLIIGVVLFVLFRYVFKRKKK